MSAIRNNLVEAAARLGSLIEAHVSDAGRQLGEMLRPYLRQGETLPDFALVLRLPVRMIRRAGERLRRNRHQLDDSRSEESEARFWRDQTASALRRKLVEVRRLLTAALGRRRAAALLGIEGRTAHRTQPALLLSQAGACSSLLRDPRRLALPRAGTFFDPAAVADTLEPLAAVCGDACGRLDEVRKASAARLEAEKRARCELGHGVRGVVFLLGGWLLLIRRRDLAEKLRPIRRLTRGRRHSGSPSGARDLGV